MGTSRQPGRRPNDLPSAEELLAAHPLDPLTADEVREVAAILRRDRGVEPPRWRFASIELNEPPKAALREPRERRPLREALAVCWNREDGQAYRAVVSLMQAFTKTAAPRRSPPGSTCRASSRT